MQEQLLFEYAVIRVMPRVEREEFINVGVILYCAKQKFLGANFLIDENKLLAISNTIDIDEVSIHLDAVKQICIGGRAAGTIGQLDVASRFRWLTATRSTVVQTSKVHPGFCLDPTQKLTCLFKELVL